MSRRRRRRGRGASGNGSARKGRSSKRDVTREKTGKHTDSGHFWGDRSQLPPPRNDVRITDDAHAVPRSLGEPPLPQQREIAEHYFAAVYDRAVATAAALAAAGGLIQLDELTDETRAPRPR